MGMGMRHATALLGTVALLGATMATPVLGEKEVTLSNQVSKRAWVQMYGATTVEITVGDYHTTRNGPKGSIVLSQVSLRVWDGSGPECGESFELRPNDFSWTPKKATLKTVSAECGPVHVVWTPTGPLDRVPSKGWSGGSANCSPPEGPASVHEASVSWFSYADATGSIGPSAKTDKVVVDAKAADYEADMAKTAGSWKQCYNPG